jgi:hypothetical protein
MVKKINFLIFWCVCIGAAKISVCNYNIESAILDDNLVLYCFSSSCVEKRIQLFEITKFSAIIFGKKEEEKCRFLAIIITKDSQDTQDNLADILDGSLICTQEQMVYKLVIWLPSDTFFVTNDWKIADYLNDAYTPFNGDISSFYREKTEELLEQLRREEKHVPGCSKKEDSAKPIYIFGKAILYACRNVWNLICWPFKYFTSYQTQKRSD